ELQPFLEITPHHPEMAGADVLLELFEVRAQQRHSLPYGRHLQIEGAAVLFLQHSIQMYASHPSTRRGAIDCRLTLVAPIFRIRDRMLRVITSHHVSLGVVLHTVCLPINRFPKSWRFSSRGS